MEWSEEETQELQELQDAANDATACDKVLAVAARAVELVAARGGEMTADQVHDALDDLGDSPAQRALGQHIAAQGARIAELEARCAALSVAGEEPIEHVNMACGNCEGVQPESCATGNHPMLLSDLEEDDQPLQEGSLEVVYPRSGTCTHDDAKTPGHSERVKERREAVVATLADARPETEDSAAAIEEGAEVNAYDRGAEAMRAACWEAVQEVLQRHGWSESGLAIDAKSAIEGATPCHRPSM